MIEVFIWNVKFNILDIGELVSTVDSWLSEGRRGIQLTGIDYNVVVQAQKDELLRRSIMESDIANVDSYLPAKYLKKAGYGKGKRVPTPDVMDALLEQARRTGRKVFFLGATDEVLLKLKSVLESEYPGLAIAGMRNGYFSDADEPSLIAEIKETAPDYLFIGMPSPRKEIFIAKYRKTLPVGCFYGVGGAFDAKAGVFRRPPRWLQGHGMEGVLRMLRRPGTYGRRFRSYMEFFRIVKKQAQ